MEIVTLIVVVVLAGLVGVFLFKKQGERPPENDQSSMMMQQQIESLRNEVSQSLKTATDTMFQSMRSTSENLNQQITLVTQSIQKTTDQVNQQLSAQTSTIGSRLDTAAKVIGDLQKSQGQLLQATEEMKQLGVSVAQLEGLLKAPKLRGGLGESMLEDLLKQVIPASSYATQYRFRNGNTVDAIVRTANGIIPIDSKFPLENFRKMAESSSEAEKKSAYKVFVSDVKKHIDAIAQKYIAPDEGTFDFALMYIPAENIYYETIIKNDDYDDDTNIYNYGVQHRVFSVSPNTFYAQLHVLALGFKGMEVEKSAKEIIQNLARLQGDLQRFADEFETVGKHLTNAKNKYDEAARKLDTFEEKLKNSSTGALPVPPVQGELLP
jgi:DNA recombination protein RmuC